MLTGIYQAAGITVLYVLTMLLTRYIFLIHSMQDKVRQFCYLTGTWVVCGALAWYFGRTPAVTALSASLAGYIFLTGSGGKRRFFRLLQVFPILGTAYGLIYPPLELPNMLMPMDQETREQCGLIIFGLYLMAVLIFLLGGYQWRKEFRADMHFRHLQPWERTLLYVIGTLMFFCASTLPTYDHVQDETYRALITRSCCVTSLVVFIVTLTIIILILQGNRSAHLREQIMRMQHNIIITMADIVENRDENTGGHIRRTAKYVELIAQKLKAAKHYRPILTDQYIRDMIIAAPLHDIGKIHIPDAVLKKEGRFEPEEFEIMKSHTTAGRRLLLQAESTLGGSSYLDIAVQMAGSHHEWWDGSGYPAGLRGQEIPLCARIMAVADVFDAIVSKRCYKGAISIEEAYELIRKESGVHFDPVVVTAFLEARDEITAIAHEFSEEPAALPEQDKQAAPEQQEAVPAEEMHMQEGL